MSAKELLQVTFVVSSFDAKVVLVTHSREDHVYDCECSPVEHTSLRPNMPSVSPALKCSHLVG